MKRINQLGRGGFRALLWHQGESDSNQKPEHQITGDDYRRLLESVIRESRRAAGWEIPLVRRSSQLFSEELFVPANS